MPATSFSRSTESHNQDKVSMGTIAARDCLRVLDLTEQVVAALVLATHQAIALRRREAGGKLPPDLDQFLQRTAGFFEFLDEDRRLDETLQRTLREIRAKAWSLYP
jgi:histidine ammonia-lyase